MSSPNKLPSLLELFDFCKGLAIAQIVFFHYYKGWWGWQGVHIFIVASGFGLTYAALSKPQPIAWKSWYWKRLVKIIPAYWIVLAGVFVVNLAISLAQWKSIAYQFILDLTLLRNCSYHRLFGYPNAALWFVPFIVSCYLIFPWIYRVIARIKTVRHGLQILAAACAIEFIYRAISIYALDGFPISQGNGFISIFPMTVAPLDRVPNGFIFQLWSPFGFCPARLGEFVLGAIAAKLYSEHPHRFEGWLLRSRQLALGIILWLLGSWAIYWGH